MAILIFRVHFLVSAKKCARLRAYKLVREVFHVPKDFPVNEVFHVPKDLLIQIFLIFLRASPPDPQGVSLTIHHLLIGPRLSLFTD